MLLVNLFTIRKALLAQGIYYSSKGTPYDIENGALYKLHLSRSLERSMGGKKTDRVNDISLVSFPWQLIYLRVFSAKFC